MRASGGIAASACQMVSTDQPTLGPSGVPRRTSELAPQKKKLHTHLGGVCRMVPCLYTWIQGCTAVGVHGCMGVGSHGCMQARRRGGMGAWVLTCTDRWMHGGMDACRHGCRNTQAHGCRDACTQVGMVAWIAGYLGTWRQMLPPHCQSGLEISILFRR